MNKNKTLLYGGKSTGLIVYEMLKEKNKKYALITMCIGVGQGYAAIIENIK